jgi:hypothetical protein
MSIARFAAPVWHAVARQVQRMVRLACYLLHELTQLEAQACHVLVATATGVPSTEAENRFFLLRSALQGRPESL